MKTKKQLMVALKSETFALQVLKKVEEISGDNFKSLRRLHTDIKTIQDYLDYVESDSAQQSVWLTIRFAYEFENAIQYVLRKWRYEVLVKKTIRGKAKSDFGVRVKNGKKVEDIFFEVKTSRSKNKFTGATHSNESGKVNNYVFVNYNVNIDYELPSLKKDTSAMHGAITDVHFAIMEGDIDWSGKASNNSSFTIAQIPVGIGKAYTVSLGATEPKTKYMALARESLMKHRNNQNILEVICSTR